MPGTRPRTIHESDARDPAIPLETARKENMDSITNAGQAFRQRRRTGTDNQSVAASIAVICTFAAIGPLATNIFLPSLPAIAADLHVSSALATSAISIFLAVIASDN